jgi:hypothetical protein
MPLIINHNCIDTLNLFIVNPQCDRVGREGGAEDDGVRALTSPAR